MRWIAGVLVAAAAVAMSLATASAPAADAPLDQRTLFLTERFTPTSIRGALSGDVVPQHMVALRGEREGFQLAVHNTTAGSLSLAGRVHPDNALGSAMRTGAVSTELLRVAFTNVPTPSTRLERSTSAPNAYKAGTYADALPPLRNETPRGRLTVPAGQWGGVVLLLAVRADAPVARYGGTLELYVPGREDVVVARQDFSVDVRNATLRQPGEKDSFKTVMGVEGEAYWLQHSAMRNGPSEYPAYADRMLQLQGLMSFLDSRGVTPTELPFASPSKSGKYSCSWGTKNVPNYPFIKQLRERYFGPQREIDPSAKQFPVRMAPAQTAGCNPDRTNDDYTGKVDKYRTPSVKQDDLLHSGARAFYRNVAREWKSGMLGSQTYVKNPFDEPSDRTDRMRVQYTREVPKATKYLRAAFGKQVKVVLADWPRDNRSERVCRTSGGKIASCATISGDGFSNRSMWDGRGTDEVDVWVAPMSRLFGRVVPAKLKKSYKINRDTEYATRLARIKKLKGGREVWAYNFFTGNAMQPQLTIDAPGTDARMNYWLLAREGHTGLYVSNSIMGWGTQKQYNKGRTLRKGNPWDDTLYFQHQSYGQAAGWGTFLYPGYNPALGLDSEEDRNSALARPVSSLRMEGMRDGLEDANLMLMYRKAKGEKAVKNVTKPIFPGTYRALPRKLGNVVTPSYDNGRNLALRLEKQRRKMINQIAG